MLGHRQLAQLDAAKTSFFSNVSHELSISKFFLE